MKKLLVVLSCLSFSGCSIMKGKKLAKKVDWKPPTLKSAKKQVKAYWKGAAIDPDSTRIHFTSKLYKGYIVLRADNFEGFTPVAGWNFCYTVNSKNRMGGYTGNQSWVATFDKNKRLAGTKKVFCGYGKAE